MITKEELCEVEELAQDNPEQWLDYCLYIKQQYLFWQMWVWIDEAKEFECELE